MSGDEPDYDAMYTYASRDRVLDLIAEAWRVLSDPDDGAGKGNRYHLYAEVGYLDDDWSKDTKRTIKGFAAANPRPAHWPWGDERFDVFPWRAS